MTEADVPVDSLGPLSEDPHWKRNGPRKKYVGKPEREITYGRLERDRQLIAFFYFSDDEDAAGCISLRRAGDAAANAGLLWSNLLRSKWERGLNPSEAMAEIEAGETVGRGSAYLVPGSLTEEAASYRALKEKAKSL